jgi:diacylglycerol kinase family enzyme
MSSAPSGTGLPLFVVLNSRSGHDDASSERTLIEQALRASGRHHEVLLVDELGALDTTVKRAVQLARQHHGAVVAAGGDGTINAVAHAALEADCPMGVIPQGTFNYFGRTHGIPQDTEAATDCLLSGQPQPVQVGRISSGDQTRTFIVNASLGLYPKLLEDREAYKREYGRSRLVAMWAALMTLSSAHRPLRLQLQAGSETRTVRTQTLFIGNNALQLQQTGIPGVATLESGALVAIMLKPVGTLSLLSLMLRGALGKLGDADRVISFGFNRLAVQPAKSQATQRIKVATDGEVFFMRPPLTFEVAPRPLMLVKPLPQDAGQEQVAAQPAREPAG